jgi:motility quorum-sensing regulator/GCU-specific mRNA interferase toxin
MLGDGKAYHDLPTVKRRVSELGAAAFTNTALDGGRLMGLTSREMLDVIAGLELTDFYKSMTTHADSTVWQDVYHASTPVGKEAYIKVTMRDDGPPVIQFKEK